MCIIVVKEKDKSLPQEKYLKNCFDNNPDGAGFMYVDNKQVVIDKGYMNYKSFMKRYKKLCKKYNNFNDKSLIMHFRIGTAGANSRENCHPYPVHYDKNVLHKTYYKTNLGMAHNGIIHDYNPPREDKTTNDTQNFIMKYVYPLYKHYPKFYKNKYIMEGMEDITNSKLAFLDKYDNIYLVGKFETDEEGILYSNSNYLPYTPYYKYYDVYGYRDYADYDYPLLRVNNTKEDEEFVKNISEIDDEYETVLEANWYYSTDEKPFEYVGEKLMVYDYYYGILYEVNDMGDYEYLSNNVMIFDENGEEVIL